MIRPLWNASVHVRVFLRRYMPTNVLLDAIRTRRGLKWGVPAMMLAGPCLLAASVCTNFIADGGPGWLNLFVMLFLWNMMKFVVVGPISVTLLATARLRAWNARRHADVDPRVQGRTDSRKRPSGAANSRKNWVSVAPTTLGSGPGARGAHRRGPQRARTAVDTLGPDHKVIEHLKEPRQ